MSDQEAALSKEQLSNPTISMTCPDSGCNFSSFEYRDPNASIDMPTNRNDAINPLSVIQRGQHEEKEDFGRYHSRNDHRLGDGYVVTVALAPQAHGATEGFIAATY